MLVRAPVKDLVSRSAPPSPTPVKELGSCVETCVLGSVGIGGVLGSGTLIVIYGELTLWLIHSFLVGLGFGLVVTYSRLLSGNSGLEFWACCCGVVVEAVCFVSLVCWFCLKMG